MRKINTQFICVFLIWVCLFIASCQETPNLTKPEATATAVVENHPEFSQYFEEFDVEGSFLLYDLNQNKTITYNPERTQQQFIPASTFKIMNSLIGLETGVIDDADFVIPWDGTEHDYSSWNQDHTLRTAIRESVVWYYQELARRVGETQMQQYIDAVEYGNQDISGGIDQFWLEGGLHISQVGQIDFLRRLYQNELPFSQRSMDIVKEIIVLEETDDYRFSGKTGLGLRVNPIIGWLVGYVEKGDNVYFYAINIESEAANNDFGQARFEITKSILRDLEIIDS